MQLLLGFFEMSGHPAKVPADLEQQSHALIEELKRRIRRAVKPYSLEGDFYTRAGKFTEAP
ncbi:MAG: hypothetical protein IPP33_09755 [Flavobacteriales bacterium]|nr:hypothetical protein [Flavobacteriales bacterium]